MESAMVQVRKACVVGFNHVALEVGDIEEETIAANAIPIPVPTSVAALRLLFMFRPFVMAVSGASPEITDANLAHESPEAQPDPGTREAKPSAAVTEREEEPVQAERRIVQSQRGAPAKRTVANIGTNEVKPSVFVNLGKHHRRQQRSSAWSPKVQNCVSLLVRVGGCR